MTLIKTLDKHQERSSSFDPTEAYPKHSSEIEISSLLFLPSDVSSVPSPTSFFWEAGLAITTPLTRTLPTWAPLLEWDQKRVSRGQIRPLVGGPVRDNIALGIGIKGLISLSPSERFAGGVHSR